MAPRHFDPKRKFEVLVQTNNPLAPPGRLLGGVKPPGGARGSLVQLCIYTHYGYIRTTVKVSVLVVLTFTKISVSMVLMWSLFFENFLIIWS